MLFCPVWRSNAGGARGPDRAGSCDLRHAETRARAKAHALLHVSLARESLSSGHNQPITSSTQSQSLAVLKIIPDAARVI
eukprot:5027758-Pleurochrysis_carterae.AAC.1